MYKCFVVCPFGDPKGTPKQRRLHAERMDLRRTTFARVAEICAARGYPISIEDGDTGLPQGVIQEDTARRIDQADVVILVATSAEKPNTWIELGWAQGFWQDPIFLVRKGFSLPSDVIGTIYEAFSTADISGENAAAADALAQRVAERIVYKLAVPERKWPFQFLEKSTTLAVGKVRVYERFSKAVTFERWSSTIQAAEKEIFVASPRMRDMVDRGAAFTWLDSAGRSQKVTFDRLLFLKALEGVQVTILMQSPGSYTIDHMVGGGTLSDEKLRESVEESYAFWAKVMTEYRQSQQSREATRETSAALSIEDGFRVIPIQRRLLPFRVTLTEKQAFTTLRFYSESVNSGLCIESRPARRKVDEFDRPFYEQIRAELEFLVDENRKAAEDTYQDFLRQRR